MTLFLFLRLAAYAAVAGAIVFLFLSIGRRSAVEKRGRRETPTLSVLTEAEADRIADEIMNRDRVAAIAHRVLIFGFIAGSAAHVFIPFRYIPLPSALGAVLTGIGSCLFIGGASLVLLASLVQLFRRLGGRVVRLTRRAKDLAPLLAQILFGLCGIFYGFARFSTSEALASLGSFAHMVSLAVVVISLPGTKLFHILGFGRLKAVGIPRLSGALPRDPGVDALRAPDQTSADGVRIGLAALEDLSSLQRIEASACLDCGICDDACPAALAGKTLSPRRLTMEQSKLVARDKAGLSLPASLSGETESCTQCYACESACPFSIRKVDRVAGLRRHALLERGETLPEWRDAIRRVEKSGNVFGMEAETRKALLAEAGIPVWKEGERPDYLVWLGCHASSDSRMRAAVLSLASSLRAAGLSFAAFEAESCCGDALRRIGEENLFLDLAAKNIEAFRKLDGVTLLTVCPHCRSSIGRDYAALGATVKVVHSTEILERLGTPATPAEAPVKKLRVAYHDSCYLARLCGIVEEPRLWLGRARPDVELVPLTKEGADTLCCGGGGGRVLADEKPAERLANLAMKELTEKKVDVLLVSCPYCLTMYSEAAAGSGLQVMDLVDFGTSGR